MKSFRKLRQELKDEAQCETFSGKQATASAFSTSETPREAGPGAEYAEIIPLSRRTVEVNVTHNEAYGLHSTA